jgi:hypothetical protein
MASKAAFLRLACTVNNATVVLTITHSHVNTPCWYQAVSSTSLTWAARACWAMAS